jgi:hypothetical protein
MPTERERVWTILGGLHLDLAGEVEPSWFQGQVDAQYWTDWKVEFGGVGGNLAKHMTEVGASFHLLAVVGSDGVGAIVQRQLEEALTGASTQLVPVPGAATGVVSILHLRTAESKTRRLIGPRSSAVDVIGPEHALSLLQNTNGNSTDLVMDGYLIHRRHAEWIPAFQRLQQAGWRIHLELVPHDSWRHWDTPTLTHLISSCASVSSSMSTLERTMKMEPVPEMRAVDRANRMLDRSARVWGDLSATVYARFGVKEAEYSLRMGGKVPPRLHRYDTRLIFKHGKSSQDRIFVHELTGCSWRLGGEDVSL